MVRCPLFKVPMFLQLNATDMGMDASSNVPARDHPVLCRLFQFHLYREFHLYNKLAGRPRGPTRVGFLETSSSARRGEGGGVGKGGPLWSPGAGGVSAFP